MVIQYLHTLSWQLKGTEPSEDSNGFPIPGTPGATKTAKCRYENFKGTGVKQWVNSDGITVLQKGTIYVKKGEAIPTKFEIVSVAEESGNVVFEGEALNVYKGQLNTTIAV